MPYQVCPAPLLQSPRLNPSEATSKPIAPASPAPQPEPPSALERAKARQANRTPDQIADIQKRWDERAKQQILLRAKARQEARTPEQIADTQKRWKIREYTNELPNYLSKEERKAIALNNIDIEAKLSTTKGKTMSVDEADKQSANPHYFKSRGYRINCQTCSPAYVLRTRGFDVTAKEKTPGSLLDYVSRGRSFELWLNPDGSKPSPIRTKEWMDKKGYKLMTKKRYEEFFQEACPKEGIYILTIGWKGGGGHATILQRFSDGTLLRIEPQKDNSHDRSLEGLSTNGASHPHPVRGVLRVDDKIFNVDFLSIFDVVKRK